MLSQSESQILESQVLLKDLTWEPLEVQGSSNRLYKARVLPGTLEFTREIRPYSHWILRWNADEKSCFGVDRALEQDVLMSIDGFSWSPDIIYLDPQGRFLVLPCYETVSEPFLFTSIQPLLSQLQTLDNVPKMQYPALFERYRLALANDIQGQELLAKLVRLFQHLPDKNHSLVHHDLHPGNILLDGSSLKIIDWEYAGLGCPWLDLAAVSRFCELTYQDIQSLPIGVNRSEEEIAQYMKLAAAFNQILSGLWCRVRDTD